MPPLNVTYLVCLVLRLGSAINYFRFHDEYETLRIRVPMQGVRAVCTRVVHHPFAPVSERLVRRVSFQFCALQ